MKEFELESQIMIEQHQEFKRIVVHKTEQIESLISVISNLEHDLSLMRLTHDYEENHIGLQ